ncbi:MAG: hypothetical protein WC703_10960 [Candidatus Neomarinimicrobiota bacterium]
MKINKKYLASFIAILVIVFPMTDLLVSQTDVRQKEQLVRDIDVLENVLDDLIIKESPLRFNFDDHVRGVYLDGFGLLFDVESYGMYNLSNFIRKTILKIPRIDVRDDKGEKITVNMDVDKETESSDDDKTPRQIIDETKNLLTQFYVNYASSVKSLGPNDRICVNIRIRDEVPVPRDEKDAKKTPSQLRATAFVSDLTKFRQCKLDETSMVNKIQFTESTSHKADRDIDVMGKIFDSALGKSGSEKNYTLTGSTRGLYLENFGVLFFSPAGVLGMNTVNIITQKGLAKAEKAMRKGEERMREAEGRIREAEERLFEAQKNLRDPSLPPIPPIPPVSLGDDSVRMDISFQFDTEFKQTQAEKDSILNKMKIDIIEIVGQYGHTLRKIRDSECILVAVDLNDCITDDGAKRVYFKFKKSDVMRYNREEITFDTFKETVKVWSK